MDTRRRCCFQCPGAGRCISIVDGPACTGPNTTQRIQIVDTAQVVSWVAVNTDTQESGLVNEYRAVGVCGIALSALPNLTDQQVIDAYGLAAYPNRVIESAVQYAGVWGRKFQASRVDVVGAPAAAVALVNSSAMPPEAAFNTGFSLSAPVECQQTADTDPIGWFCFTDFQFYPLTVTVASTVTTSSAGCNWSRTVTRSAPGPCAFSATSTQIGSITLTTVHPIPTFIGPDPGFDCNPPGSASAPLPYRSRVVPSDPSAALIDPAVESFVQSDPLRRCRGCGQ